LRVLLGPSTTWGCPRTGPATGFETASGVRVKRKA
jgi:hypothetical protein